MLDQKWNNDWKFWEDKDSFALVWNIPENAKDIDLPHDAMIENKPYADSANKGNTGFRDGSNYNYVKMLYVPEEARNKTLMLKFEGVYMNALVYVNEQLAAKNMFGYNTFYVPLDAYLRYGQNNEIRVQVRNSNMTNSRWYSGSGIYRDVYLLEAGLTYIVPEGVQVKCESADSEYGVLCIKTEIMNRKPRSEKLVLETVIKDEDGLIVASEKTKLVLFAQEMRTMTQRLTVDRPKL